MFQPMNKWAICLAACAAVFALAGAAMADSIATIENDASGTAVNLTAAAGDPIISAILSQPGTYNGKTYSSWSFFVNDGTGSMDVYRRLAEHRLPRHDGLRH